MTGNDMVIGRDYLLKKPSRPSLPKTFLDQQVVPAVVNAASACETALDRAARRTGVRPAVLLAGLIGAGSLLAFALAQQAGRPLGVDHA